MRRRFRRRLPAVGFGGGIVAVAALSIAQVPIRGHLNLAIPALLFVPVVIASAVAGGRRAAAGVALAASLALNVAFTPPYGSLKINGATDAVAVIVLLLVALIAGSLAASLVERTDEVERRSVEVEQANQRLQALSDERARLAAEAARVEALEAVDEQRRALLRSVSHDLRTPLATIRGVASDLRHWTEYEPEVRSELLDLVCDEAERLDRLVANLLSMSRIEAGSMSPDRQVVDLVELVDERIRRLRRLFRQVRVQLDRGSGAMLVSGDHSQLQQVVTNLLENAARHAPQGSTVWVSLRRDVDTIALTVADEGAGVPDRDQQSIFEPFRTSEGSRSSGIGLAICRAVVEAHGGHISVRMTPGGGATFVATLPSTNA